MFKVSRAGSASGVAPSDCGLRSGKFRDMMPVRLPHVLGVDAAGVVDEVSAGATMSGRATKSSASFP
nr:hypothetical protein [Streptomyces sp. SAI-117]